MRTPSRAPSASPTLLIVRFEIFKAVKIHV